MGSRSALRSVVVLMAAITWAAISVWPAAAAETWVTHAGSSYLGAENYRQDAAYLTSCTTSNGATDQGILVSFDSYSNWMELWGVTRHYCNNTKSYQYFGYNNSWSYVSFGGATVTGTNNHVFSVRAAHDYAPWYYKVDSTTVGSSAPITARYGYTVSAGVFAAYTGTLPVVTYTNEHHWIANGTKVTAFAQSGYADPGACYRIVSTTSSKHSQGTPC